MNLNDQIALAEKYTTVIEGTPVKDQSSHANFAMEMVKRQQSAPAPEPVKTMPPIIPIAN